MLELLGVCLRYLQCRTRQRNRSRLIATTSMRPYSTVNAYLAGRPMLFSAVAIIFLLPFHPVLASPVTAPSPPDPDPYESVNTSVLLIEEPNLDDGTRITAWSSTDQQIGSGTIQDGRVLVVVRGDDAATSEVGEGARPEAQIYLKAHPPGDTPPYLLDVLTIRDVLTEETPHELRFQNDAFFKLTVRALPEHFELAENYPNPFRSSTTITYTVPTSSSVTLDIFNTLGQRVARLVDERKTPGSYTVELNASRLASGVYIYQLRAGKHRLSRKMLVVR